MFRVKKVSLSQIGPFGKFELEFPEKPQGKENKAEIHIFSGENGSGKTTLLEALVSGINHQFYPALLDKISSSNAGVSLSVSFNHGTSTQLAYINGSTKIFAKNTLIESQFEKDSGQLNNVAFFAYSGYRKVTHAKIESVIDTLDAPKNLPLDFQQSTNDDLLLKWIANMLTRAALAKNEADVGSANKFQNAVHNIEYTISQIIGSYIRFHLQYDPLNVLLILDGIKHNFNALPDGLKSMISWIGDLLMKMEQIPWNTEIPVFERNFILFLDEIEVHMHPAWQRKVLPAVQKLFPNAQIFISTHSPFIIGSIDDAWIYKLVKLNGTSRLADQYPMRSEDAKSYQYWLNEVFGIQEMFGPGVEHDMNSFYNLRNQLLNGANGDSPQRLLELGRDLARQSSEINQIIQMEIRQINRLKGLELVL